MSLLASMLFMLWVWLTTLYEVQNDAEHPGMRQVWLHLKLVLTGRTLVVDRVQKLPSRLMSDVAPYQKGAWTLKQFVRLVFILTPVAVAIVIEKYSDKLP